MSLHFSPTLSPAFLFSSPSARSGDEPLGYRRAFEAHAAASTTANPIFFPSAAGAAWFLYRESGICRRPIFEIINVALFAGFAIIAGAWRSKCVPELSRGSRALRRGACMGAMPLPSNRRLHGIRQA